MADENTDKQVMPWEKYADAKVGEPPQETPSGTPAEGSTPKVPEGKQAPWEKYADWEVVDEDAAHEGNVADATEQAMTAKAEAQAEEMSTGERVLDWIGDMGRSTFIGAVSDPISALILSKKFEDEGVTYKQALDVVRANNKATNNTSANIVGAILGGGALVSGAKLAGKAALTTTAGQMAAQKAAKTGIVKGAAKFAASDKKLKRMVAAGAAGGAAGGIEEGIRVSIEEAADAHAGYGFDGDRVRSAVVMGTLVGGMATPALQEAVNGAKWFFNFGKQIARTDDATTYQATKRLLGEFARDDETLDQAADRFRQKVVDFRIRNGRVPAAGEIMAPEQVRNVAEIMASHNGLDMRARELSEEGVKRALRDYDDVVTGGKTIAAPEYIEAQMEDLFTSVMGRHGKTMVPVEDETMTYLMRNREFISELAQDVDGAKRISHILDARANIDDMKKQYRMLSDKVDNATAKARVDAFRQKLAVMLDDVQQSAGANGDEIAELRSLIKLNQTMATTASSARNASQASFNLEEFKPAMARVLKDLENYEKNGLKVSLSDANAIRARASSDYNTLRRSDPTKAATARRLRDAVAPIGKNEVPEYASVVKRWNLEMNRVEAQDTGIAAARGEMDLQELETRLVKGRPGGGRPRAQTREQRGAMRKGAAEGARRELQNQVDSGVAKGVQSARRISESSRAQGGLKQVLGSKKAGAIKEAADQVVNTYNSMAALAGQRSASQMAQDARAASELFTGAAFSNLGGAGRAEFMRRFFTRLAIPRGTAKKMVEMLGNPDEIDKAVAFAQRRGIKLGAMTGAISAALSGDRENE